MKNKLLSILGLVLVATLSTWYYLACKFEKQVADVILPKINAEDSFITADLDSVIIDKFKFRITLKDVSIHPKTQYFAITTDQMMVSYIPFSNNVTLTFNGNKLTTNIGEISVYSPSPSDIVTFNKELLDGDFNDINITWATPKEESIYLASDDQFISSTTSSNVSFSSKLSDGNYSINTQCDHDGMLRNPDFEFLNLIPESLRKKMDLNNNYSSTNDRLSKINKYFRTLIEQTGPQNHSGEYSIILSEEKMKEILSVFQGKSGLSATFNEAFFTKDDYSVSLKQNTGNASLNNAISININNDGTKINSDINASCTSNYSNEQGQEAILLTNEALAADDALKALYTASDFTPLSTTILDLNKLKFKLNAEYDLASGDFTSHTNIGLNDFNTDIDSSFAQDIFNLTTTIKTPKLLIDSAMNLYDVGVKPLLDKNTELTDATEVQNIDLIVTNIRDNGFNALATLHNNDELKESDALVSNLIVSLSPFSIKLNDKSLMRILTDARMQTLLQAMPKDKEPIK